MADVLLLDKCKGINNVVDPVRLQYDPKVGMVQLAMAVNVDIDDTGRVSRRKGYTQLRAEECHSIWSTSDGLKTFYVSGGSLYRLSVEGTRTGLRSGLTAGQRMSYCQPSGAEIYYSNGFENGKIVDDVSYSWIGSSYVGPTLIWKVETVPPVGKLLGSFGGYLLIAADNILWYSLPFSYSWYVLSRDRVEFESEIVMLGCLTSGVWLGTLDGVYWLGGAEPGKWSRQQISSAVSVQGSAVVADGNLFGEGLPGKVVVWASKDGIFVGDERGQAVNVTRDSLSLGRAGRGYGTVYNGRYICILE